VAVVTRPLWFMTLLDCIVLGGQVRGTLDLMRVLQQAGERGDPSQANQFQGHRQQPCSSGASSGTTKTQAKTRQDIPTAFLHVGLCSPVTVTSHRCETLCY
jgi:hypothetical protein